MKGALLHCKIKLFCILRTLTVVSLDAPIFLVFTVCLDLDLTILLRNCLIQYLSKSVNK